MANLIDMNGWDTIAAISYEDVNASIVANSSSPANFSQVADASNSATGQFGQWQLTTGGAGPNLVLSIPITGGQLTVNGTSYNIEPATAKVLVRAGFLPQPGEPSRQALALEAGATIDSLSPAQPDFNRQAVLQQLLSDWLNSNLQEFNHTFAVVDFGAQFEASGMDWLRPSHTGYAVAEPATGATLLNSVFAVLCLVDGKTDASGLVFQVSPYSIPTGRKAGFVISPEKFLQHMMLAATPFMFEGISGDPATENFQIDNNGTRIINTKSLTMNQVKVDDDDTVSPTIAATNFSIIVNGTELEIAANDMQFTWSPGIDIHLNYSAASTLSFDPAKDSLGLSVANQTSDGSVEVGTGLLVAEVVISVAGLVLTAVGGFGGLVSRSAKSAVTAADAATLGAAESAGQVDTAATAIEMKVLGKILTTGTAVEIGEIGARWLTIARICMVTGWGLEFAATFIECAKLVAKNQEDELPKVSDLTSGAMGQAVIWPDGVPGYKLASAQLAGALQFGFDQER